MAMFAKSLVAALAAATAGAVSLLPAHADQAPAAKVLGPLKAGIFKRGGKQALAYYEAEKNVCKVTVLLTEPFDETAEPRDGAVRFKTAILAGTSTRVETNEGPSLAMVCAPGAATLFVQTVDRVAFAAPAK